MSNLLALSELDNATFLLAQSGGDSRLGGLTPRQNDSLINLVYHVRIGLCTKRLAFVILAVRRQN